MYLKNSSPTLTNVTFTGNQASDGGGMYNDGSSPILSGVTFSGNRLRGSTFWNSPRGLAISRASDTSKSASSRSNVAWLFTSTGPARRRR